jgi:hypothetical protein
MLTKITFVFGAGTPNLVEHQKSFVLDAGSRVAFAGCGHGDNTDQVLVGADHLVDSGFVENCFGDILKFDELVVGVAQFGIVIDDVLGEEIYYVEGAILLILACRLAGAFGSLVVGWENSRTNLEATTNSNNTVSFESSNDCLGCLHTFFRLGIN